MKQVRVAHPKGIPGQSLIGALHMLDMREIRFDDIQQF